MFLLLKNIGIIEHKCVTLQDSLEISTDILSCNNWGLVVAVNSMLHLGPPRLETLGSRHLCLTSPTTDFDSCQRSAAQAGGGQGLHFEKHCPRETIVYMGDQQVFTEQLNKWVD